MTNITKAFQQNVELLRQVHGSHTHVARYLCMSPRSYSRVRVNPTPRHIKLIAIAAHYAQLRGMLRVLRERGVLTGAVCCKALRIAADDRLRKSHQ